MARPPHRQGGGHHQQGQRAGGQHNHGDDAVTAPFRFARINRAVHFPAWGDLVSHDAPFADGHNGEIGITITTKTPLMVGRGRDKRSQPGTVLPFRSPDGSFAIPGSGLAGVIRSVLEVATFGKLGPLVKDQRFGVRDLTGKSETARLLYKDAITDGDGTAKPIKSKAKAGWLIRKDGQIVLVDCDYARVEMDRIASGTVLRNLMRDGDFRNTRDYADAPKRYETFLGGRSRSALEGSFDLVPMPAGGHTHSCGRMIYAKCQPATGNAAGFAGTVVLTGKASPTIDNRGRDIKNTKHMEFVFHTPSRGEYLGKPENYQNQIQEIPATVWRDFLNIHEPEKSSGRSENPNWAFWKGEFAAGQPVPVFYLTDANGAVMAMGTAQMFKLAMPLSTHEMLASSTGDHVEKFDGHLTGETGRFDMASLIFGVTGGKQGEWFRHSLKRRASFDMARIVRPVEQIRHGPVILSSPKPSYYPVYVRQKPSANRMIANLQPYAAYKPMNGAAHEVRQPELAGTKIWPARGKEQIPPDNEKLKDTVKTYLNTVPAEQQFTTTLRVHNLRAVELGALLWALSFGQDAALADGEIKLRHRLGGGKPFGFGEVEIRITSHTLDRNDGAEVGTLKDVIGCFTEYMAKAGLGNWAASPQVQSLIKAATPVAYIGEDALTYIATPKSHMDLRGQGHFLPGFADGPGELPRSSAPLAVAGNAGQAQAAPRPTLPPITLKVGMRVKLGDKTGTILRIDETRVLVRLQNRSLESWDKAGLSAAD